MSKKTEADLALDEKIDLARTLIRYKQRRLAARELNDVEDLVKRNHEAEIAAGSFTQIDFENFGPGSLAKELPSGEDSVSASNGEAEDSAS